MKYPIRSQKTEIEKFAKSHLSDLNWVHTCEMRKIGHKIAKKEGADLEIVDMGILFHDIAKEKAGSEGHAQAGAEITNDKLRNFGSDKIFNEAVCKTVRFHAYPLQGKRNLVKTLEAKIVFDTDMVQQLSCFGILKHILIFRDLPVNEIATMSLKYLDVYGLLFTKTAKKMARMGDNYVKDFFNNIKNIS